MNTKKAYLLEDYVKQRCKGSAALAAEKLGVSSRTIYYNIKRESYVISGKLYPEITRPTK